MLRGIPLLLFCVLTAPGCDSRVEPSETPVPMPGTSPFAYPLALWDQKVEGQTMLMVHVTEHGVVDTAYVHEESGFAAFDSAALAGAKSMRFSPGRQGDRRIAMWTKLPVKFVMDTVPGVGLAKPPTGTSND
jgi:TonB family protein